MKYILKALPGLFSALFLLSSCAFSVIKPRTKSVFALDTAVSITYYEEKDENAVLSALKKITDYEKIFSRTDPESELYKVNHSSDKETIISDELYSLLKTALHYCEISEGKFDITLGNVNALYDFSSASPVPPESEALKEALKTTGYTTVSLKENNILVRKNPEVCIDLGAIAKGYIGDRIRFFLIENGVSNAIVNLGGNIILIGKKPESNLFGVSYKDYTVGIQKPEKASSEYLLTLSVSSSCVVTSGTYERSFTYNNELYHHILNPSTGLPVKNGYASVSVISESSVDADALSTLLFILGPEESEKLVRDFGLNVKELIYISDVSEEITRIKFGE